MIRRKVYFIVFALVLQSMPLQSVPSLSYKDRVVLAVNMKVAQAKRQFNEFKAWLKKEETQDAIVQAVTGVGLTVGMYWLWFHHLDPFKDKVNVGNSECDAMRMDAIPAMPAMNMPAISNRNLIQLRCASQGDWFSSIGGLACPHYAIYFDALLHNQLHNPNPQFAQNLTSNERIGQLVGAWRQFVIGMRLNVINTTRILHGQALIRAEDFNDPDGGDDLELPEMHALIAHIRQANPNFYADNYNYTVIDDINVITNPDFLRPVNPHAPAPGHFNDLLLPIIQGLRNNNDYTAGILISSAEQYDDGQGIQMAHGHWLAVRVVKRAGVITYYVMESFNNDWAHSLLVRRLINRLEGN